VLFLSAWEFAACDEIWLSFSGKHDEEVLEKVVRNFVLSSFLSGFVFSYRLHVYSSLNMLFNWCVFHATPPIQIATKKEFKGLKSRLQESLLLSSIARVRVLRLACSVVCTFKAQFVSLSFSNLFEDSSVTISIEQDHRDMAIRLSIIFLRPPSAASLVMSEIVELRDVGWSSFPRGFIRHPKLGHRGHCQEVYKKLVTLAGCFRALHELCLSIRPVSESQAKSVGFSVAWFVPWAKFSAPLACLVSDLGSCFLHEFRWPADAQFLPKLLVIGIVDSGWGNLLPVSLGFCLSVL
jgi:hypothetical protein